jgi:hypothetical protein
LNEKANTEKQIKVDLINQAGRKSDMPFNEKETAYERH